MIIYLLNEQTSLFINYYFINTDMQLFTDLMTVSKSILIQKVVQTVHFFDLLKCLHFFFKSIYALHT